MVSDTSSLEEAEEKIFSEARPLIVTISKPASAEITEEISSAGSSQTSASVSQEAGGEEETRLRKAYEIASELLNTEKHYVAILHLIDQVTTVLYSWGVNAR